MATERNAADRCGDVREASGQVEERLRLIQPGWDESDDLDEEDPGHHERKDGQTHHLGALVGSGCGDAGTERHDEQEDCC